MYVGILTGPFGDAPLENVAAFAAEYGFGGLEIVTGPGSQHIDTESFSAQRAREVRDLMDRRALQISSLASYTNVTEGDPARRQRNVETVMKAIDIAHELGVETVCTLAGLPPAGKDRFKTIQEDCKEIFPRILDRAEKQGVRIALENWTATNIQHLGHWEALFDVVPHPSFGLNFDPSHLAWQDIDYLAAVEKYAKRIFHTHGKDTEIRHHRKHVVGNQGQGWWRYVIPGLGCIRWGEYIGALRKNGYDGVISIEHEDDAVSREEGFLIGKKYLEQFFVPGAV